MSCEAQTNGCWIKEMGAKAWKFMREQSIGERVDFGRCRWIASQESEG